MSSDEPTPLRITKRKLDDAIQSLDDAVSRPEPLEPPPKRANLAPRSLYTTLLKYGIKTQPKESSPALDKLPKNTPNLTAILTRAASKTRQVLRAPSLPKSSGQSEYRPSSLSSFLNRLSTFKLSTYGTKPPEIDAVAASRCGWVNEGKDRLVCNLCHASWVVVGRSGMAREAANALVEKQRISLVENHKSGCPWRTRQCDDSIYCIPLQSPAAMAKEIRTNAVDLSPFMRPIQIKHPLSEEQVSQLSSTIASLSPALSRESPVREQTPPIGGSVSAPPSPVSSPSSKISEGPSDTAIIASLFGWSLAPAAPPPLTRSLSSVSRLSRASSLSLSSRPQSPFRPSTPSRASSVISREESPTPSPSRPSISRPRPLQSASTIERKRREAGLLQCKLCQRRVGLWSFTAPQQADGEAEGSISAHSASVYSPSVQSTDKIFDLLREHRSYCPYVVSSTIVPSLPLLGFSASDPMVGWRAVLTVVLRHGMSQRQQSRLPKSVSSIEEISSELNGVHAMVEGVKAHGGKDLLRYVKELLG